MKEPIQTPEIQTDSNSGVDQVRLKRLIKEKRDNQNLALAVVGGLAAALIGAGIWAAVTALTKYQIGWMAIGVGALVGFAVRFLGKGVDQSFGIVGAVFALLGCLAGNLLTVVYFISQNTGVEMMQVLSGLTPDAIVSLAKQTFNPMDLVFYGLAVYEGYKFAFVPVQIEEVGSSAKGPPA